MLCAVVLAGMAWETKAETLPFIDLNIGYADQDRPSGSHYLAGVGFTLAAFKDKLYLGGNVQHNWLRGEVSYWSYWKGQVNCDVTGGHSHGRVEAGYEISKGFVPYAGVGYDYVSTSSEHSGCRGRDDGGAVASVGAWLKAGEKTRIRLGAVVSDYTQWGIDFIRNKTAIGLRRASQRNVDNLEIDYTALRIGYAF